MSLVWGSLPRVIESMGDREGRMAVMPLGARLRVTCQRKDSGFERATQTDRSERCAGSKLSSHW